jgi:hypothetical protein
MTQYTPTTIILLKRKKRIIMQKKKSHHSNDMKKTQFKRNPQTFADLGQLFGKLFLTI